MANITYDASGDLVWHNPADGTEVVYNLGDIAFVLIATALVFVMSPGVGFFYSGLQRRKNALSAIFITMSTVAVVTLQWFICGFSLTFSDKGSLFIGDFYYFAMRNTTDQPPLESTRIPIMLYCIYELMFAAMTAAIAIGAIAERGRPGPSLIFIFIWTTIVYDPIACWTWNTLGWSKHDLGVLDFAGGIPVHITSGASALAISFHLGRRHGFDTDAPYKASNATFVALGTVLMWFGWFGFNGGSALSANLIAIQACINTNIAAAAGGLTGMILDYRIERKWSPISFCSGVVAGLITITPGSGFVGAPAALLFGILGGGACNFVSKIMIFGCDDALAIFACHGVGGFLGSILTGIFAQKSISALNGAKSGIDGGWLDQNWKQVAFQAAGSAAAMVYSFIVTLIILKLMALVKVLDLKASTVTENLGIDLNELGEPAALP